MTRAPHDEKNPPVTLEEQYECATVTSDLGLPHGPGAGAQGILAAAAWNEVHLGSALLRLRAQWETERPRTSFEQLKQRVAALPRSQRRSKLTDAAKQCIKQYFRAHRRLRDWHESHEALSVQAAMWDIDEPVAKADSVLRRWLDDPELKKGPPPHGEDGSRLWAYLEDCHSNAKRALRQGTHGLTKHYPDG